VKATLKEIGFENDAETEKNLREKASLPWFKNTVMVFNVIPEVL
jgi:hypothetical protein